MADIEAEILRWCRSQREGICMRNLSNPKPGARVGIVDVCRMETARLYVADTWDEIHATLTAEGWPRVRK